MENRFINELKTVLDKYPNGVKDEKSCAFIMVSDGKDCDLMINNAGRVVNIFISLAKQNEKFRDLIETVYDEM